MQVFTSLGEVPRTVPLTNILELGAGCHVPFVYRRFSNRVVEITDTFARANPERNGCVGGAEGCRPDVGDIRTQCFRQHGHAGDIAKLPLICPESERRVALDVFNIAITLAKCQPDVCDTSIVLEVDELLRAAVRVAECRYAPQRL